MWKTSKFTYVKKLLKKHTNTCSSSDKWKRYTNIVFRTDFEQMPCLLGSIILKSLKYRQYSTKQKLAQIRNICGQRNVICDQFHNGMVWWSTATFFKSLGTASLFSFFSLFNMILVMQSIFKSIFKKTYMLTNVAHQICCFSWGISSISSFNIDSVFVKKEHPGYCKELKGTIGSFHFSTKCFTVLQEWMACSMRFL